MSATTQHTKEELRELPIDTDSDLMAAERETTVNFPNDLDTGRFHTEVRVMIKWVLSIEESEIVDYRLKDGALVAVTADVPKGVVRFQKAARKSDRHADMVSYGSGLD